MKKLLLVLALASQWALPAKADVLANFTFSGSSLASFDADPNSTATSFVDGPGFISTIDTARGNPTPSIAIDSNQTDSTTQGGAVTSGDYFTFTITPGAGQVLNLTSLTFDYANYTNSGAYPTENFIVRSSIDNFGANLASAVTSNVASAGTFANANISLTAAQYQNVTSPIEFRFYVYDGTTSIDKGALVDNIVLNGTALVPEPATYMLMGLGFLVCAQQFRRKKA